MPLRHPTLRRVVFGLFNILEYFTNLLLYWVPFYYTIKFFLVLWLTLPQFRVCAVLAMAERWLL